MRGMRAVRARGACGSPRRADSSASMSFSLTVARSSAGAAAGAAAAASVSGSGGCDSEKNCVKASA